MYSINYSMMLWKCCHKFEKIIQVIKRLLETNPFACYNNSKIGTYMFKEVRWMSFSTECKVERQTMSSLKGIMTEWKYVTRGKVLVANVFPIVASFSIA